VLPSDVSILLPAIWRGFIEYSPEPSLLTVTVFGIRDNSEKVMNIPIKNAANRAVARVFFRRLIHPWFCESSKRGSDSSTNSKLPQ